MLKRYLQHWRSIRLMKLFERTGQMRFLAGAIRVSRHALAITPDNDSLQALLLNNLGIALLNLFQRTGEMAALTEAIKLGRDALAITPSNNSRRPAMLYNLAWALHNLFERTGEMAALTEAIKLGRDALAITPTNDLDRALSLNNLGIALHNLFERTGEMAALTEAIKLGRDALAITPSNNSRRPAMLSNLATALWSLFKQTGELHLLTEAIQIQRDAVKATPINHPYRPSQLNNLHLLLDALFDRTKEITILKEAIHTMRDAVAATPASHIERAKHSNNLGMVLLRLFHRTKEPAILKEAAQVLLDTIEATPADHFHRILYLNNVANIAYACCELTGEMSLLAKTITLMRTVATTTNLDHPPWANHQFNLGLMLTTMFERTGNATALTEAQEAFTQAGALRAASISARIDAYRKLGNITMLARKPKSALAAFEAAVELLPQLTPRALSRSDREHGLGRLAGLAAEVAAAAVAAGAPERAVELLEQTRGLLIGEVIDARSDLTELRCASHSLAAEFDDLRKQAAALEDKERHLAHWDRAGLTEATIGAVWEADHPKLNQLGQQRRHIAEQWDSLMGRIRATAGFEQFLRPPPITRLRHQADAGPIVVVYASRWRADALVISPDRANSLQVLALPKLTLDGAAKQIERLQVARSTAVDDDLSRSVRKQAQDEVHEVLGWLWDTIAGPVLDHLRFTAESGSRPRIWWCPIGALAYLPLHAAGHHTDVGSIPVRRTVIDRAVSSYAITLRALEHARAPRTTPQAPTGSSVIIAMPTTPQAPDLPGVNEETQTLARLLARPLILTGPGATYQAVADALPQHRIAHFACHGLTDWANPAASRLLLHDHASSPLTVTALMRLHLPDADLAYLSACSTTGTSQALADEAVHLTAAVHVAGYRHVIGTLWPINDTAATQIATHFYTYLTNSGSQPPCTKDSAYALVEATYALRAKYPALPTRWAAHVHLGP